MTDAEIIKALEHHKKHRCYGCPLQELESSCTDRVCSIALALINRQQAEIERLHKAHRLNLLTQLDISEKIKAEAIKEFEERLIELYTDEHITDDMHCSIGVIKQNIYDVKKIMVGDNNAER